MALLTNAWRKQWYSRSINSTRSPIANVCRSLKYDSKKIWSTNILMDTSPDHSMCLRGNKTLKELQRGVVYQIPCGTCKQTCIGQTGRTLGHRLKEINRVLTTSNAIFSAVAEHAMKENHNIAWDDAKVLDANSRLYQRCYLEGRYNRLMESAINRDEGLLPSDLDKRQQIAKSIRLLGCVYFLFIFIPSK